MTRDLVHERYEAWKRKVEALHGDRAREDPWVNGQYAFYAVVGGLIAMFIISVVGVGL
jgi:hypothetical protein